MNQNEMGLIGRSTDTMLGVENHLLRSKLAKALALVEFMKKTPVHYGLDYEYSNNGLVYWYEISKQLDDLDAVLRGGL